MAKYRHSIWCDTEGKHVETTTFSETPPTECPNDSGHTVDPAKISVVEILKKIGEYQGRGKSEDESSTSSSSWQTKLSLTTETGLVGEFQVEFFFEVARSGGSKLISFRVENETDGEDLIIAEKFYINQTKAFAPISGWDHIEFDGSAKTFSIQYKKHNASGVKIRNARIYYLGPIK